METFDIGDRAVGPGEPTYVIAEAGSNHNGDLETAKELIDAAADAGADAVKFQTFRAEDLYVDDRGLVDDPEDSTYALLESLEQPYEWIPELYEYCESRDIQFMSSPFDERSAAELAEYVPAFKVASFTLSHHPFLEELAEYDKPVIMSTGAHEQAEVEEAVGVLRENGVEDIALLHCVSSYPTSLEEINVRAVETLDREFDTVVGFSDHTTDPATAPAAAVALGASVVEKHFTLDKEMEGPDHSFALEPEGLVEMIEDIRSTEKALGDGSLSLLDPETGSANRARRRLFVSEDISAGERLTDATVDILRPGYTCREGLHPRYYDNVLGAETTRDLSAGDPLTETDIDVELSSDD
ncbi:N-acetylneuraminate synthase family protein [Halobacteria archaeon AArc-m2/3/4]|uniref:N-acetylneuraminate synthase family protein n=1 Tax=Natronoglomus mannanivorans TaxID=2979990 RepID=A0ABT2QJ70_9EURY|nr:N-acetylneuraminate synthase family protein [Halobacteria archaeon AArc-m2/3/4]